MHTTSLSSFQHRFWVEWQLNPTSTAYTTPLVFRLSGELKQNALLNTLRRFVHSYDEGCRSFFRQDGEQPVRVIVDQVEVRLDTYDATELTLIGKTPDSWIKECIAHVFALDHPVLFQFSLLRIAADSHLLVLAFPHIISDAFSAVYINRCLTMLYNSEVSGETLHAPVLPDFDAYLAQESSYLHSDQYQQDINYWLDALAARQLEVELPRQAGAHHAWANHFFMLPAELANGLKKLAKRNRTTPFLLLSTVYAICLARVFDLQQLVITYPVNMRPSGMRGASGCFVNNLPMWFDFAHEQCFRDTLHAVTTQRSASKMHQMLPLTDIIGALRQQGALSETVFLNVSISEAFFVQQEPLGFTGIRSELLPVHAEQRPFDLNFAYQLLEDGIAIKLEHHLARLTAHDAADFATSFSQLISYFVEYEEASIFAPVLLTERQFEQVQQHWHGKRVVRDEVSWMARFFSQLQRTPEAIAVRYGTSTLSYAQLNLVSAQLAGYLATQGVSKGSLVGLYCERSIVLVVAIIAILRSGAAYVPLDTEAPLSRIQDIVEDAGLALVLTQTHLLNPLLNLPVTCCAVDQDHLWRNAQPLVEPLIEAGDTAYVIYTSGSTGKPKGVANSHRGLVNRLDWQNSLVASGQILRVLQKTPYFFDVSVWEILWPLQNGFELVIAAPGVHRDPAQLLQVMQKQAINVAHFVPSMLSAFLEFLGDDDVLPALQTVICSGEALFAEQAEEFHRKFAHAALFNLYGPTEAAIDVTSWQSLPGTNTGHAGVALGRPIDNVSIYILNSRLEPCLPGRWGDLYIGGVAVAQGYLQRADLNALHFLPDPFAGHSGATMYRTGDIAMFDTSGVLHYRGRRDEQIKINGNRIELRDVEACLLACPGVTLCAVVPIIIQGRCRQLHVYVECSEMDEEWHADTLNAHVNATLPAYMRPAKIERVAQIELLPAGKINRKKLSQMAHAAFSAASPVLRAKTPFQQEIAVYWMQLLGISALAHEDDFFALGGSSIQAIQLIARLNKRYGLTLSPQILYSSTLFSDFYAKVLLEIGLVAKQNDRLEAMLDQLAPEDMDELIEIISSAGVVI